jgi:hypothetical protein
MDDSYQEKVHDLDKQIAVLERRASDADKAVEVALTDLGRRLDEMNQFRSQINEERGDFVQKETFDLKYDEMSKKVDALSLAKSNQDGRLWMLGVVLGALTVILNLALKYLFK